MKCIFTKQSLLLTVLTTLGAFTCTSALARQQFNVLFLIVDDLRPALGCYGDELAHTPNLDSFSKEALRFNRAYCQQAICGASRCSVLTGRRPDRTGVYYNTDQFRKHLPDIATLPQHFKNHGYHTQSMGKVFHDRYLDDPDSWSTPSQWFSEASSYHNPESLQKVISITGGNQKRSSGPSWECSGSSFESHNDGRLATAAIQTLHELKDKPFFLAVGFRKPHLPFVAPKQYFDLHPIGKFSLPEFRSAPEGAPEIAMQNWGELRNYSDIPDKGSLTDKQSLELIRAYYSTVSFIDDQVGRVLAALDETGLRETTIVVLWGDHGWHLGDHGLWCKHTNFENAARTPLFVSVPGMPTAGKSTDSFTELLDLYPTLASLCNLPVTDDLDGTSLVPLLNNLDQLPRKTAFYQYPRRAKGGQFTMGYAVRTEQHRLTKWFTRDSIHSRNNDEVFALELYDYKRDPAETINHAHTPEYQTVVDELSQLLDQHLESFNGFSNSEQ